MYVVILLYLLSLLATVLAFRSLVQLWQDKRQEMLVTNENLISRNRQILDKNRKLQEENEDLEKKVNQAHDLYEITREIGATLEFESIFQIFSKKITEMFFFRRAELILLEEKDAQTTIKRILEIAGRESPAEKRAVTEKERFSQAESLIALFANGRREAVFISDAGSDPWVRNLSLSKEVKSFVVIPLIIGNKILSIVTIENAREDDFARLSAVAAQLSLAINKAQLYQEVQNLSLVDGLTGAFLRRHFRKRLEEELQRSRQQRLPLSLLMVDIDHFKEYNDKHGHLVGDAVLKNISYLLREGVRETDLVARYGGEEFSLLLVETNQESALQIAERLRLSVEKHQFQAYDEAGKATISIGLATFPKDAQEAESLIDKADQALYQAKQSGRNRVCTLK